MLIRLQSTEARQCSYIIRASSYDLTLRVIIVFTSRQLSRRLNSLLSQILLSQYQSYESLLRLVDSPTTRRSFRTVEEVSLP